MRAVQTINTKPFNYHHVAKFESLKGQPLIRATGAFWIKNPFESKIDLKVVDAYQCFKVSNASV